MSPWRQKRDEGFDDGIHRTTGLDHDHDLARGGEGVHEVFQGVLADKFLAGVLADEFVGDGGGAVVNRDLESAGFHVENEILAHDGQTDESEIAIAHNKLPLEEAGKGLGRSGVWCNPLLPYGDAFRTLAG